MADQSVESRADWKAVSKADSKVERMAAEKAAWRAFQRVDS